MDKVYKEHILSPCCNAFTNLYRETYYCTRCGEGFSKIDAKTNAVVKTRSNTNFENNINNIYNYNLWHDARNWYNDETLQLINFECPLCKSYCRFARDLLGEAIYICSSEKCKCVFNEDKKRIDDVKF